MAKIKKIGMGIMGAIRKNFRAEEVLPREFSDLKAHVKNDYSDFML